MTTLLVAAAGGHLQQLHALRGRLRPTDEDVIWATFDTPQSRSLLAGEDVTWVDYPRPRDLRVNAKNAVVARRLLRRRGVDRIVSTGSSVAVSFFSVGRTMSLECHYIESATRLGEPSMTGRIVERIPGVHLYCQHESWVRRRWSYRGSVFDGFEAVARPPFEPSRIVVTTGSARDFGFRRLIERVHQVAPAAAEILWQTGSTDVSALDIEAHESLPGSELRAAIEAADLVISHAGIGSSLVALDAGRRPLLAPRRASFGEHVDDHQIEIASALDARNLARRREASEITLDDLTEATGWRIRRQAEPPILRLG